MHLVELPIPYKAPPLTPPYAPETRLDGWDLQFNVRALKNTRAWRLANPEQRSLITLMITECWDAVPIGALPADIEELAGVLGFDPGYIAQHYDAITRGWELRSDGNLYLPAVTDAIFQCLERRQKAVDRKKKRKVVEQGELDLGSPLPDSGKVVSDRLPDSGKVVGGQLPLSRKVVDECNCTECGKPESLPLSPKVVSDRLLDLGKVVDECSCTECGNHEKTTTNVAYLKNNEGDTSFTREERARLGLGLGSGSFASASASFSDEKESATTLANGQSGLGRFASDPQDRASTRVEDSESTAPLCPTAPAASPPSARKYAPLKKIRQLWLEASNSTVPMFAAIEEVENWPRRRLNRIRALWKDKLPTLEAWKDYIEIIANDPQIHDRLQADPSFVVGIDWALRDSNLISLHEGSYRWRN